jgi:putative membrane protein
MTAHEPSQNPYPANSQEELARERNHAAADRSLLSFVRNSLTLMSTGVGLYYISQKIASSGVYIDHCLHALLLALIGLGITSLIFAILDYRAELQRLRQAEYSFCSRWSLAEFTGWAIFLAGLYALLWLTVGLWS